MPNSMGRCDDRCGYFMQTIILLLACGGVVLSVLASENCEFLKFESVNDSIDLDPPFDSVSEGWIGIFQYEIIRDATGDFLSGGCTLYDDQFTNAPSTALMASQFCAVLCPSIALLAILLLVAELLCCRFYGSFILISLLLLAAASVQGGTFSIFAQPSFCFDSGTACSVGAAAYFSASAAAAIFTACVLLCCSPRPGPCLQSRRISEKDDNLAPGAPMIVPPETTTSQTASDGDSSPPADYSQLEGTSGAAWLS